MNLQSRVKKIEEETGIADPCWMCEATAGITLAFRGCLESRGVFIPNAAPWDLMTMPCVACGKPEPVSLTNYDKGERELYIKTHEALAAHYNGKMTFEELNVWLSKFIELCDRKDGERIGEHFKEARACASRWVHSYYDRPDVAAVMRRFFARRERASAT